MRLSGLGEVGILAMAILVSCAGESGRELKSSMPHTIIEEDSVVIERPDGWLKLQAVSDDIIRVGFSKDLNFFKRASLAVVAQPRHRGIVEQDGSGLTFSAGRVKARVDSGTGNITFLDSQSTVLLSEKVRDLQAALVQGENTFHVRQQWNASADESLFGLGENQLGLTDLKGYDLDLWQHNGTIVVPMLVSSKGYGILWDSPSFTRFGDLRPFEPMPVESLVDAGGKPGGLTAWYFSDPRFETLLSRRVEKRVNIERHRRSDAIVTHADSPLGFLPSSQGSARWEGSIVAAATGDYQFQAFSDGQINVTIDGKMVMDNWRQSWLPWKTLAKVHFEAGRSYPIKVEWSRQNGSTIQLLWKTPGEESAAATSLWSEVGEGVDYYFVNGPKIDGVISGYRRLTGRAPMMPVWAFGLWQSRQRYETAQDSLDVIAEFRQRGIPFDNIVQDWRYWPEAEWGSHKFDPDRFPNPKGWIDEIHRNHARVMISVWGKFYPGTDNFRQMQEAGYLYPENLKEDVRDWLGNNYAFFDAFSAGARQLFWRQLLPALFEKGVDAWWLDATEPDVLPQPTLEGQHTHMNPTALGAGGRVLNAYPLMECKAIYEGQRQAAPDQRVFILTRSGFAGQQRFAAASWSGDTSSTWRAMRAQIPAGIGFCMSGVPYWTMDVGGFAVPARFDADPPTAEDAEEWRELNTRWFEFGALCPILRVHGEFPNREMWEFGGDSSPAFQAQLKFDRLRYRLLPYIYSLAGWVSLNDYTMMRGLAMDYANDPAARKITDEYMFGPALLVCPVTTYRARSREVYLPAGDGWYDFWTGKYEASGRTIVAEAPYDAIPLYVRAGSILPMGPALQYTGEKPADPITLQVCSGADGDFNLYEDDGLTNAWEKGVYSLINIHWDDKAKFLTIGKRQGSFAGMLRERVFVVNVNGAEVGRVKYSGEAAKVGAGG